MWEIASRMQGNVSSNLTSRAQLENTKPKEQNANIEYKRQNNDSSSVQSTFHSPVFLPPRGIVQITPALFKSECL